MKIVIEIPEDTFFDLKKKQNRTEVDNAVLNGTPLPKRHGRLIDADRLKSMYSINRASFNFTTVVGIQKWIDNEPTIIKADIEKAEVITRGNCMRCGKELTEGLFFCKECGDKISSKK